MRDANKYVTVAQAEERQAIEASFDEILEALETQGSPSEIEIVEIELADGRIVKLEGRGLDSESIWALQQEGFVTEEPEEKQDKAVVGMIAPDEDDEDAPKSKRVIYRPMFYRKLIAGTFWFPGTQRRVWTDETDHKIGKLKPKITEKLSEVAMRLGGFADKKRKEMEGNSGQEGASERSSTSPTS